MIIDPSYRELVVLLMRPFVEEFDSLWQIIRTACYGLLFSGLVLLATGYVLVTSEDLSEARSLVTTIGWLAFILGVTAYASCGWKAYQLHLDREEEKGARLKRYEP